MGKTKKVVILRLVSKTAGKKVHNFQNFQFFVDFLNFQINGFSSLLELQ